MPASLNVFFIAMWSIVSVICSAQSAPGTAADSVYILPTEIIPQFPGGDEKMVEFISKNLKYPDGRICVEGKVYVQFKVEEDGTVSSIKTIRGIHPLFDAEAERVVGLFPKWIPAHQSGEHVAVRMVIPISFKPTN